MNKIHRFSIMMVALLLMSSCYDLDRYPFDRPNANNFFQTKEHADQAMMGVYSTMQYEAVFGMHFGIDCLGGIAMGYDNASYQSIQRGTYDVKNSYGANKFKYLYEGIARANIVLQNLHRCQMDEKLIERYKGEAKFLRALYYFSLLDFFGAVPVYDESVIVEKDYGNMLEPRTPADKVRTFILKDLDDAIEALSGEEWADSQKGRATAEAAMALKGKVLLFNKQYKEAAVCFENVVKSGKHALYPDYAGLFKPGGDESSEMVFAIQNMGGVGKDVGMPLTFYMGSRAAFGSDWNNVMAATSFVDSYEWKDGRPFDWEEVIPGFTTSDEIKNKTFRATLSQDKTKVKTYPEAREKLLKMYEERDPRMAVSVILPYSSFKGWYANAPMDCEYVVASGVNEKYGMIRVNQNFETYLWRKFVAEYNMGGAINNRAHTPINFPLIRYADVLLMLAECYNEEGKQDDAVGLINEVRARVNMPGINSGPAWLEAQTKNQVFARIRHERAVELAAEGLSFSDMRRWGLLETLNEKKEKDFTGKVRYTRKVSSRDYLWPIPAEEIEKNSSLKPNNPGW